MPRVRLAWDFVAVRSAAAASSNEAPSTTSAARNRLLAHLFAAKDRGPEARRAFLEEKTLG